MTRTQLVRIRKIIARLHAEIPECNFETTARLLFLMDMNHTQKTGKGVTGLVYFAGPKGPVPQLDEPLLSDMLSGSKNRQRKAHEEDGASTIEVNEGYGSLTKAQTSLLDLLIEKHLSTGGLTTFSLTNPYNQLWHATWQHSNGQVRPIEPLLVQPKPVAPSRELIKAAKSAAGAIKQASLRARGMLSVPA